MWGNETIFSWDECIGRGQSTVFKWLWESVCRWCMIFYALKLPGAVVNSQAILFKYKSNILSWICTFVLMHSSTMIHMLTCTWVSCLNASSSRHTETKRKLSLADIPLPLLFYQGQNDYIPSGGSEISLGCRCPAAQTWCVGAARPFPAIALHPAREGAGGATNPSGKATACILTAGCVCRFSSCAVELSWTSFTFSHSSSSTHRSAERSFRSWSQSGWGGTPCSVDKLLRRSGARHGHALRARATARAPQSSFSASQGRLAAGPAPFGGTWHLGAVFTAEPPVWGSASGASTPHFVPTHPRPRSLCRPLHLVFPRSSRSEPLGPTHVVPAAEARGAEAGSRHTPPAPRRGSGLWGRRPAAVRRNVGLFDRRAKSVGGIQRWFETVRAAAGRSPPHAPS